MEGVGLLQPVGRLVRCEQRPEQAAVVKPLFSERYDPEKREQYDALQEGIPDFLFPSLLDWTIERYRRSSSGMPDRQMILRLEVKVRRTLPPKARSDLKELARAFHSDDALFLSAIDFALRRLEYYTFEDRTPEELENILEEAASEYCVGKDEDGYFQLQFRQSQEMAQLIQTEADQPGRAADHLRRAWAKCFRVEPDPDPNAACSEAVSAVEAAAKPVISPNNQKTTLGTLLRDMKPDSDKEPGYKWETDSEFDSSMETVFCMLQLVWNEGHYRHGDDSLPLEVTQESAEMTVQAAVLLVSWFRSGRIRMKP